MHRSSIVPVIQGPCPVSPSACNPATSGGLCAGKALPIPFHRNSDQAKGMLFVVHTAPTTVVLWRVLWCYVPGTTSTPSPMTTAAKHEEEPAQTFERLAEISLRPEEGERVTTMTLIRHDAMGATGYLLWLGTSNGTLLVVNAAPTPWGDRMNRIALVCQLHHKSLPKNFDICHGHEPIVAICATSAGKNSLRNPWFAAGEGIPISNKEHVYTRSVDVLHQSGWIVAFDEEQISMLCSASAPGGVTQRLSMADEWASVAQQNLKSSVMPASCASRELRVSMSRCHGRNLEPAWSDEAPPPTPSGDMGATAAACALLHTPGVSALDVLNSSLSVKNQRVLIVSSVGAFGPAFTTYSLHIKPEAALTAKSAALQVAGRITGAALRAVKGFWGRSSESSNDGVLEPFPTLPQHNNTPVDLATTVGGTQTKAQSIIVSPTSHYAAVVASNTDRILLLDLVMGTICRVFKGCRQCDVQWVDCPRRDHDGASYLLAVYHKIRGIVEFHSIRDAQRVAACRVAPALSLLRVEGVNPQSELLLIDAAHQQCFTVRVSLIKQQPSNITTASVVDSSGDASVADPAVAAAKITTELDALLHQRDDRGVDVTMVVKRFCDTQGDYWELALKRLATSPRKLERCKDLLQAMILQVHKSVLDHSAVDTAPLESVLQAARGIRELWVRLLGRPSAHEMKASTTDRQTRTSKGQQYHQLVLCEEALELFVALAQPVSTRIADPELPSSLPATVEDAGSADADESYWGSSLLTMLSFSRTNPSAAGPGSDKLLALRRQTRSDLLDALMRRVGRHEEASIHSVANGPRWWAKVSERFRRWCSENEERRGASASDDLPPPMCDNAQPSARALLRCVAFHGHHVEFNRHYHDALVQDVFSDIARLRNGCPKGVGSAEVTSDLLALADVCFLGARTTSLAAMLDRQAPILSKLGVSGHGATILLMMCLLRRRSSAGRRNVFFDRCFNPGEEYPVEGLLQLGESLRVCPLGSAITAAAMIPFSNDVMSEEIIDRAVLLLLAVASNASSSPSSRTHAQHNVDAVLWVMRFVALEEYWLAAPHQTSEQNSPLRFQQWIQCGELCLHDAQGLPYDPPRLSPRAAQYPLLVAHVARDASNENPPSSAKLRTASLRTVYENTVMTDDALEQRLVCQKALLWSTALTHHQSWAASHFLFRCSGESDHDVPAVAWSLVGFSKFGEAIVNKQPPSGSTANKYALVGELSVALHLVSTILIPLRPLIRKESSAWKQQLAPDRHDFATGEECSAFHHLTDKALESHVELARRSCLQFRDTTFEALRNTFATESDLQEAMTQAVQDVSAELTQRHRPPGCAASQSSSNPTLFPLSIPETLDALLAFEHLVQLHQYSADALYISLHDMCSLVAFTQWCLTKSTAAVRHSDILSGVPWAEMFAVPSLQLLRQATVYPGLDATHHALMADQRSAARTNFVCRAARQAVVALGRHAQRAQKGGAETTSKEQLDAVVRGARSFVGSLGETLFLDALTCSSIGDCSVVAHVLSTKQLFSAGSVTFLKETLHQSPLRYPCAATILVHIRRYIYTGIKWYASLEKGLAPGDKEGRTRHSTGSVKLRSSMSSEFQQWLRNKGPAASDSDEASGGAARGSDQDVLYIHNAFYTRGETDAAIDAQVRQAIGEGRLAGLLRGLRELAEILVAHARDLQHVEKNATENTAGFRYAIGELDRVATVLEAVLLEGMSLAQK